MKNYDDLNFTDNYTTTTNTYTILIISSTTKYHEFY